MTRLVDIFNPTLFAAFVERLKATPLPDARIEACEADVLAVASPLTCSDGVSPACECTVGTLILLDLYLQEQKSC